jgi:Spy/CpxP family protein refolding chaperone
MNLVKLSVLLLVIVFILASTTTFAGAPSCCQGKVNASGSGNNVSSKSFWDVLTQEQQIKARELRSNYLEKIYPIRTEIQQIQVSLGKLSNQENYDESLVEKNIRRMLALRKQLNKELTAMDKQFQTLLTSEQKRNLGPSVSLLDSTSRSGGCGGGTAGGCGSSSACSCGSSISPVKKAL